MISNFFLAVAWTLLIGIVVMTVVPPGMRVVTGAPHDVEHAVIFLITGFVFGLGYRLHLRITCAAAVIFCACLEVLQLAVPGRHARLSDFLVDAIAACIGAAFAWILRRLSAGGRFPEHSAAVNRCNLTG